MDITNLIWVNFGYWLESNYNCNFIFYIYSQYFSALHIKCGVYCNIWQKRFWPCSLPCWRNQYNPWLSLMVTFVAWQSLFLGLLIWNKWQYTSNMHGFLPPVSANNKQTKHKALPQHKGPGPVWSNKFIHSKQWLQEMISVKSVPHPQLSRVNYVFH